MKVHFALVYSLALLSSTAVAAPKAVMPCAQGFDLSVQVSPVENLNPYAADPIGLELKYEPNQFGKITRTHTQQNSVFTKAECERWQAKYWAHFKRVLFENNRPERSTVQCRNIASVRYRVGAKQESAKICLSAATADGLTDGFQRFYEGSDLMVER